MFSAEQEAVLIEAIQTYGDKHQMHKAVEECAELTVELTHLLGGRGSWNKAFGEIADVLIVLAQFRLTYPEVDAAIDAKLKRLQERLKGGG